MKSLRRLLAYVRPEGPTLAAVAACIVVLGMTSAAYAFLAGPALKYVFTSDLTSVLRTSAGELRSIWRLVPADWVAAIEGLDRTLALLVLPALIVVVSLIKGVSHTGQFYLIGRISQRILRRLRADTFASLLRQSPSFYSYRSHGDLLSRLTNDANVVEQGLFYGFGPLIREPPSLLFLLAFCFYTDAKLALVTFIIIPTAVLPLARFAKRIKRISRRGQDHQGAINAACYEALAGVRVVQAFGTEQHEESKLDRSAAEYLRQMLKSYFIRAVRTPTMEFLGAVALAGLLALLAYQVQAHNADPAHFISFFVAVIMMYEPLKRLGGVSDYLAHGAAAAERIFEVLDHPPEVRDRPGAAKLPPFEREVLFDQVRFAYDSTPVLEGVDLAIKAGTLVALVGASGSGKTTMAHLLPRFYDVTGGRILVDGRDVRDVTLASLRAQVSIVSQDTFLFNASVEENIAYGSPTATAHEIRRAARAAHAEEFIDRLKEGYATVIGERGVNLSGGQRQRLAIARALLRDSPLLILDEATSALDVESERFVQQALEVLMQGRTSLVIAHRLSTVRRADVIAVIKDGRILELGRHDELVAHSGEYARLYAMQFEDAPKPEVAAPAAC